MKKIIALLLCVTLCLSLLSGCGDNSHTADAEDEIKIVTTIFPIYDWTMNLLGDDAENYDVHMLVNNGVDMHSYQATTADMVTIHTCDVLIYVGGESDAWIESLLATTTNTDMKVIKLVDVLGDNVVFEELIEGMEATEHSHDHDDDHEHTDECCDEEHEHEHEHDEDCCDEEHEHDEDCCDEEHEHDEDCCDEEHEHEHDQEHDHDHTDECCDEEHEHDHEDDHDHEDEDCCDEEIDEHVWLSLQNAQIICSAIADVLASLDSENTAAYQANLASYVSKLKELDNSYAEMVSSASRDTVLFADRFPFRYLVDDYNLNYYAAFAGCSSETEASFETIAFLAGKVNELDIQYLLTLDGTAHKIAETVILATESQNQSIITVSSMESISSADIEAGATYISIMEENLQAFQKALN